MFKYLSMVLSELVLALLIALPVVAKPLAFGMQGHPVAWGGSCDSSVTKVLAGEIFFVDVCNRADEPLEPRKPGWPEGYALEAALDLSPNTSFVPTPGLIDRLQPASYFGSLNREGQGQLETGVLSDVNVGALNLKKFTLRMPADLAGHTITLRARCDKSGTTRYTKTIPPFGIILPCDRYDTARIVAGEIYLAKEKGDADRIILLADSMLATGLSDPLAWKRALPIYVSRKQFDKALACIDRWYEDYGDIDNSAMRYTRPNAGGPRDPDAQERYRRLRASYLEKINEQEQQQR